MIPIGKIDKFSDAHENRRIVLNQVLPYIVVICLFITFDFQFILLDYLRSGEYAWTYIRLFLFETYVGFAKNDDDTFRIWRPYSYF